MDILQKAAYIYDNLCKHHYVFELSNGHTITLILRPQNFAHLAGIRKFSDLYEFRKDITAINLYHKILRGEIKLADAQRSQHYDLDAKDRIEYLSRVEELLKSDRVVYGFDPNKNKLNSRLRSTVLLFKGDSHNFCMVLGIAPDGKTYYPETFFLSYGIRYIEGQNIVSVTLFRTIQAQRIK